MPRGDSVASAARAGSSASRTNGRRISNLAPACGSLSTEIAAAALLHNGVARGQAETVPSSPWSCRTAPNACSSVSGTSPAGVPHHQPHAVAQYHARRARGPLDASTFTTEVSIVSLPPSGIASREFTARLTSSYSIWLRSARTVSGSGARTVAARCLSDQPAQHPVQVENER